MGTNLRKYTLENVTIKNDYYKTLIVLIIDENYNDDIYAIKHLSRDEQDTTDGIISCNLKTGLLFVLKDRFSKLNMLEKDEIFNQYVKPFLTKELWDIM
jgi:hypothetical protein